MKKMLIALVLFIILLAGFYSYYSNNKDSVKLPDNITEIELSMTRVFLVKIPDGYLLFDTGYEKDYKDFLHALKAKQISVDEIKYLLLSHHHDDHTGFTNNLVQANPLLRVIVYEKSVKLLARGENNKKNGGGIINKRVYALFKLKQFITPDWDLTFPRYKIRKNDIILKKNEQLPRKIGFKGKVLYTPGHTSDSISIIVNYDYILCGDMAANFLNWAGASYATLFNEDIQEVYNSWKKVISNNIRYIVPSHGRAFEVQRLKENLGKYTQSDLVNFF